MKIAILNDTHCGVRNSNDIFLDNAEKFFTDVFFPHLFPLTDDFVDFRVFQFHSVNSFVCHLLLLCNCHMSLSTQRYLSLLVRCQT